MSSEWRAFLPPILSVLILTAAACAAGTPTSEDVQAALGCLLTADWVQQDLTELGVKVGDSVAVRFSAEPIPGTSPNTEGTLKIFVYDRHGTKAWLLFADRRGSGYTAVRNAYRLERGGRNWSAGEGNGGVATYRTIGEFATHVYDARRESRITLMRDQNACPVRD